MKRLTRLTWAAVLSCALALAGVGVNQDRKSVV